MTEPELKNKGGRPTKYNEEIVKKTIEYLENYKNLGEVIPTVAGLAVYLKIRKSTLYDWAEKYEEFSDTLETIKSIQEKDLMNQGLNNKFNAVITKLLLSTNHGYKDNTKIEFEI